jgi:outer membrane protein OmpA-like peptidoglycan-associated protein
MKKHLLFLFTFCFLLINLAIAQTEVKNRFLDTLNLGIRFQVQEFHTLNQKFDDNCYCDESLPLKDRALKGIGISFLEPLTNHWSLGADLGGSFGRIIDDHRIYKSYTFVQMRVESFYHLFDSKTRLRPYLSGSIQLATNQNKALISLPLGAGLRFKLNSGGSLHLQTAYDHGLSHALAKNMITNIGFHVPLFKRKASNVSGVSLYESNNLKPVSYKLPEEIKSTPTSAQMAQNNQVSSQAEPTSSASQIVNSVAKQLVRTIYFDTDKNELNNSATDKVMLEVLAFMAENKLVRVYLHAHTDDVQSETYNLLLSKSRADATAEKLIKQGISQDRIDVKYYGESIPLASNLYESGRAVNRRVEIVVK